MIDGLDQQTLPRASLTRPRRQRLSVVWLIPLLAAVVAIGIAIDRILKEGPTVTIVFQSAEGVEAGKTPIKYKDVTIGQVSSVELYENYGKVLVTAQIHKHAEGLMVEDAKFWVVQPRVTLSGISGLSTLLSGNYIGFERGKSGSQARRFRGLEAPPAITLDQPGRQFLLGAQDLGSLGIGSPVYFRRLQVGQVIAYDLAPDGKSVQVRVFVNAPFDRFVNPETRFWNASGIDVSMSAGGVDLRTQSLVSVLVGGVAFETPAFAPEGEPAEAERVFPLYADRAKAMQQPETIARRYVLYFDDSLRGLSVGAPVTLLGLQAGEVVDVGFDIDPSTLALRGRVEMVAQPERIVARLRAGETAAGQAIARSDERSHAIFERLISERGLRAQLRTGSLLTGQLYVALDFFPDAPKSEVDWGLKMPVIPTVPSTVPDLEAKLTGILAKLDKLPYEAIGADLRQTLETLNRTIEDINAAVKRLDGEVIPTLKPAIADFRRAASSADRVLKGTDATLLGKDAPGQLELREALQELSRAARSIRVLGDYLERHPEALLRGKAEEKP